MNKQCTVQDEQQLPVSYARLFIRLQPDPATAPRVLLPFHAGDLVLASAETAAGWLLHLLALWMWCGTAGRGHAAAGRNVFRCTVKMIYCCSDSCAQLIVIYCTA